MLKLYLLCCLLVLNASAQDIDVTFCDVNTADKDPDNLPLPLYDLNMRYQADIERNKNGVTEEITETYDGEKNIAASSTTVGSRSINTYLYPNSKEIIYVMDDLCTVYSSDKAADITSFNIISINGTDHVIGGLGLGALSLSARDPNLQVAYLGSKLHEVRGIVVKQWLTCVYEKKTQATLKITISFTDEKFWTSALNLPNFKSIPVQVQIDYREKATKKEYTEISSILRYRPGVEIKEEKLYTAPGVYCFDRKNIKATPSISNSFSYWLQQAEPTPGTTDVFGSLKLLKNEHDFNRKLFRTKYYENDEYINEIHDYNTGLNYKLNMNKKTCEINRLDPEVTSTTLSDIFKFNVDPPFQYTGQRIVRGINTDVWIAPRDYEGQKAIWEWHFMTDQWVSQEANAVNTNEPVLLTITNTDKNNQKVVRYFHITNFDQSRVNAYDFDISLCQDQIPNKHVRFTITPSNYEIMLTNQAAVRDGILYSILDVSKVSILRINQLETFFNDSKIVVTFTLLDRASNTGLPNVNENTLNEAFNNLNQSVINKRFVVSFNESTDLEKYSVYANEDSFLSLDKREGRYVYIEKETGKTIGYTTGAVIGFLVMFVLIGLALGFVAGYFFILKRTSPIVLPGALSFLNPNFKASTVQPA